jgi:hypothetical protein
VTELVRQDAVQRALAEATSFDAVKDIRARAKAMQVYAKEALDREKIDHATETRLRAEIRAGEMLAGMGERRGGYRTRLESSLPTNKELGITDNQSSRWKRLAALSDYEREAVIAEAKEKVAAALAKEKRNGHGKATASALDKLNKNWEGASEEERAVFMAAEERQSYINPAGGHTDNESSLPVAEAPSLDADLWLAASEDERRAFVRAVTPRALVEAFGMPGFYSAMSEDQKDEIDAEVDRLWEEHQRAKARQHNLAKDIGAVSR